MPNHFKPEDFGDKHKLTAAVMSPSTRRNSLHVRAIKSIGRRAITTTGRFGRAADRAHKVRKRLKR